MANFKTKVEGLERKISGLVGEVPITIEVKIFKRDEVSREPVQKGGILSIPDNLNEACRVEFLNAETWRTWAKERGFTDEEIEEVVADMAW